MHLVNRKPCTLRLKHLLLNPCSLIRDYACKLRDQQCCPYWQGVLSLGSLAWRDVHINGDRDALAKVPFLFSYQLHVASSLELVPRPPLAAFFFAAKEKRAFSTAAKNVAARFSKAAMARFSTAALKAARGGPGATFSIIKQENYTHRSARELHSQDKTTASAI